MAVGFASVLACGFLLTALAVRPSLEHHHHDKNAHVKDVHVHQNLKSKSGEEKKCCANWVDDEKIEYCWATTSCLEWGQNSDDRDYSTVTTTAKPQVIARSGSACFN